jgi:mRNA-degrading endonuclease toxin of MazEF toxin-antitoxin module
MAVVHPRGTIVLAAGVLDPNGVNPKDRFLVLLRDLNEDDPTAFGVAITGTFPASLPGTSIRLPFHRQGRCATGLTKPSVAECTWIVEVESSAILRRSGVAPPRELLAILEAVAAHLPPPPEDAGA